MGIFFQSPLHVRHRFSLGNEENSDKQEPRRYKRAPSLLRLLKRGEFDTIVSLLDDTTARVEWWFGRGGGY